jgi:CRP-like cAMP-binding protein/polyferredoxin
MITVDDLLHVDIFKELPEEDLTALIPHLIEKTFPAGITLIYRGDPGSSMFMIRDGTLVVTLKNAEGIEYPLSTMKPGDIFGEMALMTGEPRSANVKTLSATRLFELNQQSFFDLILTFPALNESLLRLLIQRRTNSAVLHQSADPGTTGNIATLFAQSPPEINSLGGRTKWSEETNAEIKRLAKTSVNILICGERGTGKNLAARLIHFNRPAQTSPLFHLDCANPPPIQRVSKKGVENKDPLHLEIAQESALFGHGINAGSYARSIRRGYLELADNGAIVLENIDALSQQTQQLLVRYLQHGTFTRVGETEQISTKVRILATTAESELGLHDEKNFDSTLQTLVGHELLKLKPLRDRQKDIPVIAEYFLHHFNQKFSKNITSFSKAAINLLVDHDWPLNTDELRQGVERAVVIANGDTIEENHIFLNIPPFSTTGKYNLLRVSSFRKLVSHKLFPTGLSYVTVPLFLALILFTFTGPPVENPANLIAWGVLWPFLILSTMISGRSWCGYCPLPTISNSVNFYRRRFLPVPEFLTKNGVWISSAGFVAILLAEHATHMFTTARATSILFLAILGGTICTDFIFGKRVWCKYLCPLGEMISQASSLSFVELRTNSTVCLSQCQTHDCIKEGNCPMGLHPTAAAISKECILCLSCVKKCPHQAIRINARLPWKEQLKEESINLKGAIFTVFLTALILAMKVPEWEPLSRYLSRNFVENLRVTEVIISIIIGVAFVTLTLLASGYPGTHSWKRNFSVFGEASRFLVFAGFFNIYFHEFVYRGHNLFPWIFEQLGLNDVIPTTWITPNLGTLKAVIPMITITSAIISIIMLTKLARKHDMPPSQLKANRSIVLITAVIFLLIL